MQCAQVWSRWWNITYDDNGRIVCFSSLEPGNSIIFLSSGSSPLVSSCLHHSKLSVIASVLLSVLLTCSHFEWCGVHGCPEE